MKRFTTAPDAKGKRVLLGLLAAVFWIAVWQAVSMAVGQELLVPAPLKVAGTLWRLLGSALFWKAAGFSLLRVAAGFLAAVSWAAPWRCSRCASLCRGRCCPPCCG